MTSTELQLNIRPSIFFSFLPPNVREHRTNNLVDIFAASACLFSDPGPGCHIVITRHLSPQLTPAPLATLATDPNISRLRLSTRSFLRPSLLSIDVTEVSMFEVLIPDICPQNEGKCCTCCTPWGIIIDNHFLFVSIRIIGSLMFYPTSSVKREEDINMDAL